MGGAKKLSSFLSLFAVEGGMDFRAMLMKRKKPAKKVVVVSSARRNVSVDAALMQQSVSLGCGSGSVFFNALGSIDLMA